MPSPEEAARAGVVDVSNMDKDVQSAYEPGTTFELADGTLLDPSRVPDWIGKGKRPAGRPRRRPKS